MAFYDSVWWVLLTSVAVALWAGFMFSGVLRARTVRGSRGRYVASTISWALAYPALGTVFLSAVQHAAAHPGFNAGTLTDGCLLMIWLFEFRNLKKADDDNWFGRTGLRLRQRLAARHLTPVPISTR